MKIVINKENFLIFQMKKKPTIYQIPTRGLHRFPLQCTHPLTGEELEPPTRPTIVLAIRKTIQGSHPERHLRRNMESTGILKNPQSPRVASHLMSDPSLKCFFFFLWFRQWPKKLDTKFCEPLTTQYNLFKSVLEYVYRVVNLIFLSAFKQKLVDFDLRDRVIPTLYSSLETQLPTNQLLALVNRETPRGKLPEEIENWELFQEI